MARECDLASFLNIPLVTEAQWNNTQWIMTLFANHPNQLNKLLALTSQLDIAHRDYLAVLYYQNRYDKACAFVEWFISFIHSDNHTSAVRDYVRRITSASVQICVAIDVMNKSL